MKYLIATLLVLVTLAGCSSERTIRPDEINAKQDNLPIYYETKAEFYRPPDSNTKGRSLLPPTTQPLEYLYGKRPLELGIITKITVPYYVPRNSSKITRSQLFEALSHYILVDFEEFSSRTHIPLGLEVTVEYDDDTQLRINMFGGMPYTAELYRQDGVSRYGLQRISEPDPPANSEKPPS